jgi:uncharacterized lipoprotein
MKFAWRILLLVPLLLASSACHPFRAISKKACHDPQPYMKAQSVPPLTIPPGLAAPDTTNALRLPPLNEPAPQARTGHDPCLDEPPSFKVPQQPARTPAA